INFSGLLVLVWIQKSLAFPELLASPAASLPCAYAGIPSFSTKSQEPDAIVSSFDVKACTGPAYNLRLPNFFELPLELLSVKSMQPYSDPSIFNPRRDVTGVPKLRFLP
ncbi:MAG TPA: hypothetical protein VJ719_11305, partial [Chthoniobacterales bacterium]|nr:hypothetical protein [Chthoniobacterales bacterium]